MNIKLLRSAKEIWRVRKRSYFIGLACKVSLHAMGSIDFNCCSQNACYKSILLRAKNDRGGERRKREKGQKARVYSGTGQIICPGNPFKRINAVSARYFSLMFSKNS